MYEPIRGRITPRSILTAPARTAPASDPASDRTSGPAAAGSPAAAPLPRRDQLTEQLAGHLGALLPHTGVLRRLTAELLASAHPGDTAPEPAAADRLDALRAQLADLEQAEPLIAERAAELAPSGHRNRFWQGTRVPDDGGDDTPPGVRSLRHLHEQAYAIAGRTLVAAASRADTRTAVLACRRMDAHREALEALR